MKQYFNKQPEPLAASRSPGRTSSSPSVTGLVHIR